MLDDLKARLDRAKEAYSYQIRQIDSALKPLVAVDPKLLNEAKKFQASYPVSPEFAPVALLEFGGAHVPDVMKKAAKPAK